MAFEKVDVVSAKKALENCLESIKYSRTKTIMSEIKDNQIWNTSARDTLYEALEKLVKKKYGNLKSEIDSCLKLIDKIEEYQKNQEYKTSSENDLSEKEKLLTKLDKQKKEYEKDKARYSAQLNELNQKIIFYTKEKEKLKSSIEVYKENMQSIYNEVVSAFQDKGE